MSHINYNFELKIASDSYILAFEMMIPTAPFILKPTILLSVIQAFSQDSWKETGPSTMSVSAQWGKEPSFQKFLMLREIVTCTHQGHMARQKNSVVLWEPGGGTTPSGWGYRS